MRKAIAIDPGKDKCGLVIADINQRKVLEAKVILSTYLVSYLKKIFQNENHTQFLIGNGTSSQNYINELNQFIPDLIAVEEKNSTYRAKQRYFEIFPLNGLKSFLPREIFLLNKNLDALAALIILEDYYSFKFEFNELINIKTWLK